MILPYAVLQMIAYWPLRGFQFSEFILDISCIRPLYSNGWYLSYILLWYIIFYVVMRIARLRKYKFQILCFASITSFIYFSFESALCAEQSFSFLMGIWLSNHKVEIMKQRKEPKLLYGIFLMILGIVFLAIKQLDAIRQSPQIIYCFIELMIKLPCALGLIIITYHLSPKINLRMFEWFGQISFSLYIIHGYVLAAVPANEKGAIVFILLSIPCAIAWWFLFSKVSVLLKRLLRTGS